MRDRVPCEFFLIRYVPDVVKGEFVNIGVLLREVTGDARSHTQAQVKFTRDWRRVRCMDAEADIGLLEALEQEIAERLLLGASARDPKAVLEVLEDTLSNSLQMTEAKATLAENMITEMELLLRLYVEPMKAPRIRGKTGRAAIAGAMRTEFERAGVWGIMHKRIAAATYTRVGDPLKIDCGYRPNGVIRMFHAVSLEGDVEAAKGLAYSAPMLRAGVMREESAELELTAVVEPLRMVGSVNDETAERDEGAIRHGFGVQIMEDQEIRVLTMNDLAGAVATARRELGL